MFSACCCSWLWVLNLRQLRDAVDELGDLGAEPLLDVGQAVLGVLGDVVQERRLDGDRVDAELGEDLRRGDRVGDVRLAGRPPLAVVRVDREVEARSTGSRSASGWCSARSRPSGPCGAPRDPATPSWPRAAAAATPGRRALGARAAGRGRSAIAGGGRWSSARRVEGLGGSQRGSPWDRKDSGGSRQP